MEKPVILHTMPLAELLKQSKRKTLFDKLKKLFGVEQKQDFGVSAQSNAQPLHPLEPLLWTMIRKAPSLAVYSVIEHIGLLQQLGCKVQVQLITPQTPNAVGYLHRCCYKAKPVLQVMMLLQVVNDVAVLFAASEYHNSVPSTV